MGIIQTLRETVNAVQEIGPLRESYNHLRESTTDAMRMLAAENRGWKQLGTGESLTPTVAELRERGDRIEAATLLNPLLKRGLTVRGSYVHGGGVTISARDEAVNEAVQAFLDDQSNASIVGLQAARKREHALFTRGEFAVNLFTDPMTGRVQARTVAPHEITQVHTDPEDRDTRRYYLREWTQAILREDGTQGTVARKAFYPDVHYSPVLRPRAIGGIEVIWDAPIVHTVANPVGDGLRGVGDAYAAVKWANDHTRFLDNYSRLADALSRVAFDIKTKNPATAARAQAQATGMAGLPTGSAFVGTNETSLNVVSKAGGTVDPEGGRHLAAMVASALGLPVTVLLSDPGVTGARATAETLDRPLILEMEDRQALHAEFWRAVLGYVVMSAAKAPQGALRGLGPRFIRNGDMLTLEFADGTEPTVDIVYPELETVDRKAELEALIMADSLADAHPAVKLEILKIMLNVLGVEDSDEIISKITNEDGDLPGGAAIAAEAFRRFERGELEL